jgi:hypothetical protein
MCQEPHQENECPQRDEDYLDNMNFMDMICNFQEEEVTHEHIDEAKRQGEREGRLWALSQLKYDYRKEMRKR